MLDARRVAAVRKQAGKPLRDAEPSFGHGEQHDATVRSEADAIEIGCDLLPRNGWKGKRQDRIIGHGGRGRREARNGLAQITQILRRISALRHARQPKIEPILTKTG